MDSSKRLFIKFHINHPTEKNIKPKLKIDDQNKQHKKKHTNIIQLPIRKKKPFCSLRGSQNPSLDSKNCSLNNKTNYRRTATGIQSATLSVQNQKKTTKNSSSKQKQNIDAHKSLKMKTIKEKIKKQNALIPSQNKKCFGLQVLGEQNKNAPKQKNRQKTNQIKNRRSSQTCTKKSQSTIKNKQMRDTLEIKRQNKISKRTSKSKIGMQIKSSCVTRNISRNNSKQKEYGNISQQLDLKFRKKKQTINGNPEKKLKKQNIYSSAKISQRNSCTLISTCSKGPILMGQLQKAKRSKQYDFRKKQVKNLKVSLVKAKSLKNIRQRLGQMISKDGMTSLQNLTQQIQTKNSFLFFQKSRGKKTHTNINLNQISIDQFLQNTQNDHFQIDCESVLRQKLFKTEELLQERELESQSEKIQNFKAIDSFQNRLQNNRSYSVTSQLIKFAEINQLDLRQFQSCLQKFRTQRIELLDWMSILCSKLLLKTQTFHLAATYLDIYLSTSENDFLQQNDSKLSLVGLGCLVIAIKMEEREYEHDVYNALATFQKQFDRIQIVQTQLFILKKLKLKLKVETLSFWFDYFSQKWDHFLNINSQNFQFIGVLYLRAIEGKSYENYQKATQILNAILFEGGIFNSELIDIVLSVIFSVSKEIILNQKRHSIFQKINNLRSTPLIVEKHSKQILPRSFTQETLDQLQLNELKQNIPQNKSPNNCGQTYLSDSSQLKQRKKINKNNDHSIKLTNFTQLYKKFVQKYTQKRFEELSQTIEYTKKFISIHPTIQMNQRLYEQAQNYEEFIRYHIYSPYLKRLVIQMEQPQNYKKIRSIAPSAKSETCGQSQGKINTPQDYNWHMNQSVDQIFTESQIGEFQIG